MPDRCHSCGVMSLDGERFGQERYPFFGTRRYCPACHRRLHRRINGWGLGVLAVLCAWGFWKEEFSNGRWRELSALWWLGVCLLQYGFVLPHELGHALVARWLKFDQIRIVIGSGKPIFSLHFLGFPWLFRLYPIGGVTLVNLAGKHLRWRALAMVAAGPAVNLGVATLAWFWIPAGGLFRDGWSLPKAVLIANAALVAMSLVPYTSLTTFGPFPSDGLQMWNLLARWNKPAPDRGNRIPGWQVVLCQVLKWGAALTTFSGVLLFLYVGYFVFHDPGGRKTLGIMSFFLAFELCFIALFGWMTFWIVKQPIARERERPGPRLGRIEALRELNPEQISLYSAAAKHFNEKNFAQAEAVCDRLLAALPDRRSPAYAQVLILKLSSLSRLGRVEAAEALCSDYVREGPVSSLGVQLLDAMACDLFYGDTAPQFPVAERLARLAVQLAPSQPSVAGTLGGLLAEQGRFGEAEPWLRQCLEQSDAFHDQAICSYYLGMIRQADGRVAEARELMKRALVLYSAPWFNAKVQARLQSLA